MEPTTVAFIWIDWYSYHLARLRAVVTHCPDRIQARGIELVGGTGVHAGLNFRDEARASLPLSTLMPNANWHSAGQLRLARATWAKLTELDAQAVFIPGYYNLPSLVAALWGKLRRRKTVLMTESTESDHERSPWKERLKGALIRILFDWAIAGGEPHVRYLYKLGFPMNRVGRFYDVVDNDFFGDTADQLRAAQASSGKGLPRNYFLYVGRLSPEKNVDGLLRAFSEYRKRGGDWDLVVVGDGPEREMLARLSQQLDVAEGIDWAGLKSTDELAAYYAFAGCFVLPSRREPWGLVVNEALAAGLPVLVSSRCGCAADLVRDGKNGFLFDPEKGGLSSLLERVSELSPSNRACMAAASRSVVAEYSPKKWAAEVERITCRSERQ